MTKSSLKTFVYWVFYAMLFKLNPFGSECSNCNGSNSFHKHVGLSQRWLSPSLVKVISMGRSL